MKMHLLLTDKCSKIFAAAAYFSKRISKIFVSPERLKGTSKKKEKNSSKTTDLWTLFCDFALTVNETLKRISYCCPSNLVVTV